MEDSLQAGVSAAGTCARLKFQSMPYSMTLMCTGFLQIWLLFLPCAIISVPTKAPAGDNPVFGLVIYFFTAILMLGVDEVANQLEQPFPHLPLQEISETTLRDIDRFAGDAARLRVCGCGLFITGCCIAPPRAFQGPCNIAFCCTLLMLMQAAEGVCICGTAAR